MDRLAGPATRLESADMFSDSAEKYEDEEDMFGDEDDLELVEALEQTDDNVPEVNEEVICIL